MAKVEIRMEVDNRATRPLQEIQRELDKTGGAGSRANTSLSSLAAVMSNGFRAAATAGALAIGGIAAGLGAAVSLGADAEEAASKFSTVFQNSGPAVAEALNEFATAAGRSRFELIEMAGNVGDLLQPLGFSQEAAAGLSVDIVKLATDLSSFNNMPMDEALRRLQGTLVGSHENAIAFGVVINENTLKAEMAKHGWDQLTGAQFENAKVQARLNLLMAGTTSAQGDAIRTSESWSNQMRALQAAFTDFGTEIGLKVLPQLTPLLSMFRQWVVDVTPPVIAFFEDVAGKLGNMGLVFQSAGGGLIGILAALGVDPQKGAEILTWRDKLVEIFGNVSTWLQDNIPKAIEAARRVWEEVLLPAIEGVWAFINENILPIYETLAGELEETLPVATETLSGIWNDVLLPALKDVWKYIEENVLPLFKELADFYTENMVGIMEGQGKLWREVLLPALEAVWDFLDQFILPILGGLADVTFAALSRVIQAQMKKWREEFLPALRAVWKFIKDNLGPMLEWLQTEVLQPLSEKIGPIADALHGLADTIRNGGFDNVFNSGLFGGFRAHGGPVAGGVPYMVGERGPEMFVPSGPGMVLPHSATRNITNNFTINANYRNSQSERTLRDDIEWYSKLVGA